MTDDRRSLTDVRAEYFKLKVEQGLADVAAGRVVKDEEARKRFAQWLDAHDPGASPAGGQV
jgi:predicted transcriptional regulator